MVLNDALRGSDSQSLLQLRQRAATPLPPTGQREGKAIRFFEQGLITGGLIVAMPILTSAAAMGYYGISAALKRMRA